MPTNYPTSLDNFTNPTANDSLNLPSHSTQHSNANDAIEAIEAKLGVGNANQVGWYHISTTNVTATSTIIIDNCFTSTYQNYRILFTPRHVGSQSTYFFKLRNGGADNANVYYGAGTNVYVSSATVNSYRTNGGGDFLLGAGSTSMQDTYHDILISAPNELKFTGLATTGMAVDNSGSYAYNMNAWHNTTAAMDGFKIYTIAGSITGAVRIYGYRNDTA